MKRIVILKSLSIIIVVIGIVLLIKYLKLDKELSNLKDTSIEKTYEKQQVKYFTAGISLIVIGLLILFL